MNTPVNRPIRTNLDRFAEHLANGASTTEAAEAVGVSPAAGNAYLQRLRQQLGEQAR